MKGRDDHNVVLLILNKAMMMKEEVGSLMGGSHFNLFLSSGRKGDALMLT